MVASTRASVSATQAPISTWLLPPHSVAGSAKARPAPQNTRHKAEDIFFMAVPPFSLDRQIHLRWARA
jgi:hypothetical protein